MVAEFSKENTLIEQSNEKDGFWVLMESRNKFQMEYGLD